MKYDPAVTEVCPEKLQWRFSTSVSSLAMIINYLCRYFLVFTTLTMVLTVINHCSVSGYKDCCQLVLCIIITPSQLCLTRDRHKIPTPVLLNNQQLILWRIYQSTSLYQWWYHIPHSSFTRLWIVKCLIVRGVWCWYCWYWPQHCQHYQLQCWTDSLPEQRGSVGGQTEELGTRNININQKISYDILHNEQIRSDLILILR